MVSTFTPNIQIEEPARGDDVGTWDTPVNSNMTLLDLVSGGIATISGTAGSLVLASAQFRSKGITVNSTLLASITLTFPTSFVKSYEVRNLCTGSSQFTVTLTTTAAGGQVVCAPPGESVRVVNDGTHIYYHNLGRIGSYWDYAGSSVPSWVSGCTVAPYLNCDGSQFSAATFPALAIALGSTTLPDSKGRTRFALDQSAGRLTSAVFGASPNVVGNGGGLQTATLASSNLPAQGISNGTIYYNQAFVAGGVSFAAAQTISSNSGIGGAIAVGVTQTTIQNSSVQVSAPFAAVSPGWIGGLTLIRSA